MTSTEATIILAYRANVSPKAIAAKLGVFSHTVENVLMAYPSHRIDTADVLAALVAGR